MEDWKMQTHLQSFKERRVNNHDAYHSSHSLVMLSPGEYSFSRSLQWHWLVGMQPFPVISSYTVPVKNNSKVFQLSDISNFHSRETLRGGMLSTWHRKQRLRLSELWKNPVSTSCNIRQMENTFIQLWKAKSIHLYNYTDKKLNISI